MSTLAELQRQKAELEKQIETAKKNERAEALKTVKKLCKEFGFTAGMLRGSLVEKRKGK
jgi:DNA-binding protein H-NS